MNRLITLVLIITNCYISSAQNPDLSAIEKNFSTPGMARFKNENFLRANPEFRWRDYFYSTFFNIGYQSGPSPLFVTDFLDMGGKYFHAKLFSSYSFDKPYIKKEKTNLGYWLPFGLSYPIVTGSNYNISLKCDYYWAIHFSDHSEYDDPENYKQRPSLLDFQVQMDLYLKQAISRLSLVYGYRHQLSDWNVVESAIPVYSNNISGSYVGLTWGFGVSFKENYGLSDWKMAKKENSVISFEKFLKTHPASHYENEANARLEYAAFKTFVKGSIDDCNYYISKFPAGYYLSEAQNRKEELLEEKTYKNAVTKGSIPECDRYLANYKNGKYVREVETRKIEIYAEMKEDSIYNQSKNGGIEDCNYYLVNYPSGKYVQPVEAKKEKLTKEIEEEFNSYNKLINSSSVADMQRHLAAYPNGNHKAEVKKMIEPLLYKAAVEADWHTEYETYIKICPDGSNIEKVTKRLEFLKTHTAKIKVDYPAIEKGGESPYSNVSSPYFEINTTFSETGGEVGYKLHGSGWIYDKNGDQWGHSGYSIDRGTVEVKPGKKEVEEYWCSGKEFQGGYAVFDWTGEDAGGHPLSVQVRVSLQ